MYRGCRAPSEVSCLPHRSGATDGGLIQIKEKIHNGKCIDTNPDEIKAYFAICFLMILVRKPKIHS